MRFLIGVLEVLAGAFVFFIVARSTYSALVPRAGWAWVGLIALLAVANMLLHRGLGSSINTPFFTAVMFVTVLMGLAPDRSVVEGEASKSSRWFRRGVAAVVVGTLLGWLSYAEIVDIRG